MNNDCLKGKSAVITGARRGIGRAVAIAYAKAGADVSACDKIADDGLLNETCEELASFGSKSLALAADVSVREDVEQMASRVLKTYGKIDVLVNCAGVWIPGQNLIECSDETWDKVIDTNLKGAFLCCRAVGNIMVKQRSGSIINMSSQVGLIPGAGAGAYLISKAGIIMMTRQLALELSEFKIRVNALAPGIVKTEFNAPFWKDPAVEAETAAMVPLGRLAEPEDIAGAAVFLASDAAGYITGQVLCINGGWTPSSSIR